MNRASTVTHELLPATAYRAVIGAYGDQLTERYMLDRMDRSTYERCLTKLRHWQEYNARLIVQSRR